MPSQDFSKSSKPSKDSGSPSSSGKSNTDNMNKNKNKNISNHKKNKDDKSTSTPASLRFPSSLYHALSPPRKSSSSSSNKDVVILTGAAIGAVLMLLVMMVCMVCCCCCRKKKRRRNEKSYSNENPSEIKVDTNNGYYSTQPAWNQHQQPSDHLKMSPQPHGGPASSDQGWVAAPPPAMVSGSKTSSSDYSNPYQAPLPPPHPGKALGFNKNAFTYDDLTAATKGFDRSLLLGQGGFGYVHKGVLPNGKEVAVKSLKLGSGEGEREFQAEVETLSRVHHRHLVSLVGYCIAGPQRMLVNEFIPNKTLEYHLHGEGCPVMDCSTRLQIAIGAAKGFAYLHEDCNPRIVHRDIKAANILLDDQYEAKVADFGLAKLSSETITHVSTRIMGTFGYLAPEYASTGKLTEKSDVFSYGVMLLELITGRRPITLHSDEDTLVDWARPILRHVSDGGSFEKMVDPRIKDNYNRDEMHRMVACATACIRHSSKLRPKMSQLVRILQGDVSLDDLNEVGKNMRTAPIEED